MDATIAEETVVEISTDEIMTEFARVMAEWGHRPPGLRLPTDSEVRRAAARRGKRLAPVA
jgi:hypothetical protein